MPRNRPLLPVAALAVIGLLLITAAVIVVFAFSDDVKGLAVDPRGNLYLTNKARVL